jgi:hypothetical protein
VAGLGSQFRGSLFVRFVTLLFNSCPVPALSRQSISRFTPRTTHLPRRSASPAFGFVIRHSDWPLRLGVCHLAFGIRHSISALCFRNFSFSHSTTPPLQTFPKMTNLNMNTGDFLSAVDHAARSSDRWLFLAAFLLLLTFCAVVIWWLVKQLQGVIADHNAQREAYHGALSDMIKTQNEMALKLAICIDRNTAALEKCTFELQRIQKSTT